MQNNKGMALLNLFNIHTSSDGFNKSNKVLRSKVVFMVIIVTLQIRTRFLKSH